VLNAVLGALLFGLFLAIVSDDHDIRTLTAFVGAAVIAGALTLVIHSALTVVAFRRRGLRHPVLVALLGDGVFYASATVGVLFGAAAFFVIGPLVLAASYPLATALVRSGRLMRG